MSSDKPLMDPTAEMDSTTGTLMAAAAATASWYSTMPCVLLYSDQLPNHTHHALYVIVGKCEATLQSARTQ